jgi:membrane associated rhomboid family serine protease
MSPGMTQKEYENSVRYYGFHLIFYPILVCLGIFVVGSVIESLFGFELGVAKTIFIAIGGVGYFILYFKTELSKKK